MIVRGIGATTHLDKHNCRIAKEALESAVNDINEGMYAIGVGIEHDSSIMPIGKVISGKLVELEDGEYGLEIEQELFEQYQVYSDIEDAKWYISESKKDSRPFADTQVESVKKIKISIDPVNFSKTDYEELIDFYEKDCMLDTECFIRKSVIPDPEIIFTLVTGSIAVMAGKKIAERLSEQVADDAVKIYELIKDVVSETIKRCKPANRPITYIVRENNPYLIELLVVTEKPNILFEALLEEKMRQIEIEIEKFINTFDVDIAKVQCVYDVERQKWMVNYVSTINGKVIGNEKCYKKAVELARRVGERMQSEENEDIL